MKCDTCPAYKEEDGRYVCAADVPDEEVKTFKDGACGCKYKEATIVRRLKDRGIAVGEQMNLLDFLEDSAASPKEQEEVAECDDDDADESFVIPDDTAQRETFRIGSVVKTTCSDELYKVRAVSHDGRSIYVEGKSAGTQVLAAADLIAADENL